MEQAIADTPEGYTFNEEFKITQEIKDQWKKNGFVIVRGLLNSAEMNRLRGALEKNKSLPDHVVARDDGEGRKANMTLWNHPGNDVAGMVARCEKVVNIWEQLLGGEVYHYHTKLIQKQARTGGKWVWHQDYGYWYENGCLFPNMGTMYLAIDRADRHNGCLQILPRSHLMGRVDHIAVGKQVAADPERVKLAKDTLQETYLELDPGDACFFHCNLLHTSGPNNSPNRRWGFLVAYNKASNNPVKEHHHPCYTPLKKVPNSAILECPVENSDEGKWYFGQDFTSERTGDMAFDNIAKKDH